MLKRVPESTFIVLYCSFHSHTHTYIHWWQHLHHQDLLVQRQFNIGLCQGLHDDLYPWATAASDTKSRRSWIQLRQTSSWYLSGGRHSLKSLTSLCRTVPALSLCHTTQVTINWVLNKSGVIWLQKQFSLCAFRSQFPWKIHRITAKYFPMPQSLIQILF